MSIYEVVEIFMIVIKTLAAVFCCAVVYALVDFHVGRWMWRREVKKAWKRGVDSARKEDK